MADAARLLVIDARFYGDIADELVQGATAALEAAGAEYDRLSVPGVLEVPIALSMALAAAGNGGIDYDGFVLLGCVIRGETSHYDIVANESARALMDIAVERNIALGNGILTVENADQARIRAATTGRDKGGFAARAALALIETRRMLESGTGR